MASKWDTLASNAPHIRRCTGEAGAASAPRLATTGEFAGPIYVDAPADILYLERSKEETIMSMTISIRRLSAMERTVWISLAIWWGLLALGAYETGMYLDAHAMSEAHQSSFFAVGKERIDQVEVIDRSRQAATFYSCHAAYALGIAAAAAAGIAIFDSLLLIGLVAIPAIAMETVSAFEALLIAVKLGSPQWTDAVIVSFVVLILFTLTPPLLAIWQACKRKDVPEHNALPVDPEDHAILKKAFERAIQKSQLQGVNDEIQRRGSKNWSRDDNDKG
jgi:hypothetical protein